MRVLLLTQFYPPEIGAVANRLAYLVRALRRRGHEVTVIAPLPNYPTGRIFKEYAGRLVSDEREDGVRVIRSWLYATPSKSFVRRMLNFCSFAALSVLVAAFRAGRQDVVIAESPPLFVGLAALVVSRLKRAALVLNISDLWPETAVALGVIGNPRVIRIATQAEELLYRKADLITGQTEGIVASIGPRCGGKTVTLIPNGVDLEAIAATFPGDVVRERTRKLLGIEGQFVVGYMGLFGLAQGLETVLQAAERLRDEPDILFALIGDGPERANLERLSEHAGLRNVLFIPPQPASRMPEVLRAVDLALVPLKRHPLFKGALPSKMFEAMGAGVPVVGSVEGEARAVIVKSQGGICVEPGDANAMADAVLRLYRDPGLRESMGRNARQYVATYYDRAAAADTFERLMVACRAVDPSLRSRLEHGTSN